ncbi:MAG: YggS family pyridoxal phosphate-dependent enzyme [Proteobacteria bacterium]|jgi:PLP dependent protein|nr:YggS family pyridoxal phosphate-dependent enzyme [Pseudomonadota bacterium]MCG6934452.1 YggS family pyridoxal phosphate-dependent enzyme [Pseudomonadota bacterium]
MNRISQRLEQVRDRIRLATAAAGRPAGSVRLLAVSKTRPLVDLEAALAAGQTAFGESYLQDALPKIEGLGSNVEWHFIGPVQANKTRAIASHFAWVHSVERLKIARRLSEQRPPTLPPINLCLQVNISGEMNKAGCPPEELPELAAEIIRLPGLVLRGLMTIPAQETVFERQRRPFRELRLAFEALKAQGHHLDTLSMGMSNDLEAAIAEGSTLVRVGTAIFGSRRA